MLFPTQSIHGWKHCLLAVSVCDVDEQNSGWTNQNSTWFTESKKADKKGRQKRRKIPVFFSLLFKRMTKTVQQHSQQALLPLSLELWLGCLDRAEMGRSKETEKVQPTTSSTGCLSVTFQLWLQALCWRHLRRLMCAIFRVHKHVCLCAAGWHFQNFRSGKNKVAIRTLSDQRHLQH